VRYHKNPATIGLVATDPGDLEIDWYVEKFGGGVMILDPMVSGRTFIGADEIQGEEDLEFMSRAES
jgi:hypothetical protein